MGGRLIDADKLIELIDDDIAALDNDIPQIAYDVCFCTLKMVKQYIEALPTVPLDWKSIIDDWTEHDNAMIAKGRELEQRLNAPKHGRWIEHHEPFSWMGYTTWTCSGCDYEVGYEKDIKNRTDYCPNCGADMREVSDDN